jgi:ribosomal protein S27E
VPSTVVYPLLSGRPTFWSLDLRADLEGLANRDLLRRRFAARVLTCSGCGSGRLSAYEACVECGSADLFDEAILHHYRCGFQDAESRFVDGSALTCPKCRRELRHIGVDYGRPGMMVRCRPCGQVMSEPQPSFRCLDCRVEQRGELTRAVDWHHYDLTDQGTAMVHTTAVPSFDRRMLAATFPRLRPTGDFILLVREQLLVAQRFARPSVVAVVGIANLRTLERDQGPKATAEAVKLFTQIIVETLRDTDLAAMPSDEMIVIAMPETEPLAATALFEQILLSASSVLATVPEITIHVAGGAETTALLDRLEA